MNRLISFDVGIKNLAYCVYDIQPTNQNIPFAIIEWDVINLIEPKDTKQVIVCDHIPNSAAAKCKRAAKYKTPTKNYCAPCAKGYQKRGELFVCDNPPKAAALQKMTFGEIEDIYKTYATLLGKELPPAKTEVKTTKKTAVDRVYRIIEERGLIPIIRKKEKSANDVNLVEIGRAIHSRLTEVLKRCDPDEKMTHVIIENQISPIATRMKTIQGMLAQFFIMSYTNVEIDFISSSNKLKIFCDKKIAQNAEEPQNAEEKEQISQYRQHKKDGIYYTTQLLEKNRWLSNHDAMNTKKKDDLADCFLQGIWYMISKKRIMVAENLKINIVSLT